MDECKVIVEGGVVVDEQLFLDIGGIIAPDGSLDYEIKRAYRNQDRYASFGKKVAYQMDIDEYNLKLEAEEKLYQEQMQGWEDDPDGGTKVYTAAGVAIKK